MLLVILSLLLNLTKVVGFSPLQTSYRVTLDPKFSAGSVCVIWDSGDEAATPGSDCWTVENSFQRTWVKTLTLRTGVYEVWATTNGQDDKGNVMRDVSPHRQVTVVSNQ